MLSNYLERTEVKSRLVINTYEITCVSGDVQGSHSVQQATGAGCH